MAPPPSLYTYITSTWLLLASTRSYTPLKVLGDGSFGTVWLCDWHGTLPPNTPLSPMQCGQGARPEWAGKRLVAVKRMKKTWEGGWDECKKLKELEVRPDSISLFLSHPPQNTNILLLTSPYAQSVFIPISSPCTISSFSPIRKSSISFLNRWKATCTTSSKLVKVVHSPVVSSAPSFAKASPVSITSIPLVTFIAI